MLLGSLVLIKLILLLGLGKHLQEIHWRVAAEQRTWLNYIAFIGVAAVGVVTLLQLSRHCQGVGLKTVRHLNGAILALGLLFIPLTFHEGANNYLYPILTGVLDWKSLIPYLCLDFFFRPPFLAGWLLGYAGCYYVMMRLGLERWALVLTAVFGGVFWVVCLRELLERRHDLWVGLTFGLIAVLLLRRTDRRLHPGWWLLPAGWTLLIWALFRRASPEAGSVPPYFALLAGSLVCLFAGASWVARRQRIWEVWIKAAPFYFLTFLLLASNHYPRAANCNNVVGFSAKFAHYFLGELCVVGLVAMVAGACARWRPRCSFGWLDPIALVLMFLALVDLRLTQVMGVRLSWDVLQFGYSPAVMWRMAKPYVPGLILAVAAVAAVYAIAVAYTQRRLNGQWLDAGGKAEHAGIWHLLGGFALLAVLGSVISKPDHAVGQSLLRLAQSSSLGKWASGEVMGVEEFRRTAIELGLADPGRPDAFRPLAERRHLNVLLILQESSYNKYSSLFSGLEETQPLVAKYRERMEIFPNFFSSFASSIHSRFATFTGLYPVRDFNVFTLNSVGVKSIFEVLSENGYRCSMFYSSYFDYTGFRSMLKQRRLDEMYDADTMPGQRTTERVSWGLREEETMEAIRRQLRQYAGTNQPFFLTYVPAAPHYPYDSMPERFRRHKPGRFGDYTAFYLNELLYMDWIIASILDELKETGLLDRTLVVITSDHGEMLGGEDDRLGHGWKVTPELANVPLIVMDPDQPGYRINPTVGSQVDLLPTVLDCLGIPMPADELYQGRSLRSATTAGRREESVFLNSYQEYAVIRGDRIYGGDRQNEPGDKFQNVVVHSISNHAGQTFFPEVNNCATAHPALSIRRFDRFQESLLRNYSLYRDALRKQTSASSGHASK